MNKSSENYVYLPTLVCIPYMLFQTGVYQGCEGVGEDVVHLLDLLVNLGVDAVETDVDQAVRFHVGLNATV